MLRNYIISMLLLSAHPVFPQEADQFIDDFFAVQQDEEVYLRWTILAGNTCDGTRIERSEDGISYYEIGEIPGVCGSSEKPIIYDFTDTAPLKNRINYYRLQLGFLGITSTKQVDYFFPGEQGYSIHPNPFSDEATFIFNNPDEKGTQLHIHNITGQLVTSHITSGYKIHLTRELFLNGTYIFRLIQDDKILKTGKFVVF